MPTYEYRCGCCEARFDVSRPMGSTRDEFCPECGAAARRVFSPVGVAFKGSGFHNTDYRQRPKDKDAGGDATPSCSKATSNEACAGCPASAS